VKRAPVTGGAAWLVSAVLSACGDGDQRETASQRPSVAEGTACPEQQVSCDGTCIDPIVPRADVLQQRVFARSCALSSSCHSGAAAPEELRLGSVDDLFATAVGESSRQAPTWLLIEPGQPQDSYLIRKLRNVELAAQSSSGAPSTSMPPPPNAALCEPKIRAIEAWILMGAPR
jgi:hypothetical protein